MDHTGQVQSGQLIDLLTEQHERYRRLRELSEQQRSLICGDRPEQLLSILQERQSLVNALTKLNVSLAPFRRNWDEMYAALPDEIRRRASELLGEINASLQVILKNDHQDSALLAARKQLVANELSDLGGTRAAGTAYAKASAAQVRAVGGAEVTG
ncbi:MAG: hypothetical protein JNG88_13945 [Phycisphaerales bacterium]|nr:hypothetical protein [Phycisphaerales bacterium]